MYSAFETNAGGLYLCAVNENNECVWLGDYTDNTCRMPRDIKFLHDGVDPVADGWDEAEYDVSKDDIYLDLVKNANLIADEDGLYPDRMGVSGMIEFSVE